MNRKILATIMALILALGVTAANADEKHHSQEGKSSEMSGQVLKKEPGHGEKRPFGMMGGHMHPCMMSGQSSGGMMDMMMGGNGSGGMMGGGMMDMMMSEKGSRGMMGSGMMWGYNLPEDQRKYLDDTLELRKKLHDMRFNYFEAARNPDTTLGTLKEMEKEMAEIKKTLADKMPKHEKNK